VQLLPERLAEKMIGRINGLLALLLLGNRR
jgi:hypothetical protein